MYAKYRHVSNATEAKIAQGITWKLFRGQYFRRFPSWGDPVKQGTFMETFKAVVKSVFRACVPLFGKHRGHNAARATRTSRMWNNSVCSVGEQKMAVALEV
ncbi:hypothetical protein K0M31_002158 [Melipona bicolor]|uniref:Uncharacterized protein n=1 Tax=Melipona bicolor TaxID=60889 RepID=A0AA40KYD7_9HYME|nr:hypothetical protein K0M31_002158 [Melipona bicolor]